MSELLKDYKGKPLRDHHGNPIKGGLYYNCRNKYDLWYIMIDRFGGVFVERFIGEGDDTPHISEIAADKAALLTPANPSTVIERMAKRLSWVQKIQKDLEGRIQGEK